MLRPLTDGIWLDSTPVRIVGTHLTCNTTVCRLKGDDLLVVSPSRLTPDTRAAIGALGRVAHVYAPNAFHHLWIADWIAAFPEARVHAPKVLAKKRPLLRIDRFHDEEPEPAFAGIVDEVVIGGFRLAETALVHRPARAAIVTDLVHNVGRPEGRWTQTYCSVMGFYDRVALSRLLRWTAFSDRATARESIDELLGHSFDTLIVGHGAPIETRAKELLGEATSFLPRAAPLAKRNRKPTMLFGKPCG